MLVLHVAIKADGRAWERQEQAFHERYPADERYNNRQNSASPEMVAGNERETGDQRHNSGHEQKRRAVNESIDFQDGLLVREHHERHKQT